VREILGLMVYVDGRLRVTGLDPDCEPVTYDSVDEGETWEAVPEPGIWRLDKDTTAAAVIGPAGATIEVPCRPTQMVNLPLARAVASCEAGLFFLLAVNQDPVQMFAEDYHAVSATVAPGTGRYYVFGVADCGAQVGLVDTAEQSSARLACIENGQVTPFAIAAAGKWVVVQGGDAIWASTDGAESFDEVS
jgi:hypothetical protein